MGFSNYHDVGQFHVKFGMPCTQHSGPTLPRLLTRETMAYRVGLLKVELQDLVVSYDDCDLTGFSDALIDLVQAEPGAIGDVLNALRRRLDPWLGRPKRSSSKASVTLVYRFESEVPPIRPLRLKIEINTREHFAVLDYYRHPLAVANPWFTEEASVTTYQLDELMGTKLRALYQRRKGRDLFDLWLCLSRGLLDPGQVVACFSAYMKHEKRTISRAEFERNLFEKETASVFLDDIRPLLATGISYDVKVAATLVRENLISRLTGEPWRGTPSAGDAERRGGPRRGKGRKQ